ncbi:PEP-CTERM sorting domain-containing protein, partial [Brunnivagina elsteri CCALA 953]
MKKVTLSAKILAAATVGFSVITLASSANAASLVPQMEGEIQLTNNGACLTDAANCIDTTPLGYT